MVKVAVTVCPHLVTVHNKASPYVGALETSLSSPNETVKTHRDQN